MQAQVLDDGIDMWMIVKEKISQDWSERYKIQRKIMFKIFIYSIDE